MSLIEDIRKAKARQAELHAIRLLPGGLQDQLHALLDETNGAERDPRIIALRAQIRALQEEKYEVDMGLSEVMKAAYPGGFVMPAELPPPIDAAT